MEGFAEIMSCLTGVLNGGISAKVRRGATSISCWRRGLGRMGTESAEDAGLESAEDADPRCRVRRLRLSSNRASMECGLVGREHGVEYYGR